MRGKCLMIQGTGSSVGKSMLCSALLRILRQDGYRVAPFKAQNMALNSFATDEGLEMGRAQVLQAEAAGVTPSVKMNPVLLKPTSDRMSQVIVNGKSIGTLSAAAYHAFKPQLRQLVKQTYDALEAEYDYVIIEGAGSPAEINLREGDIVNMSMAEAADAPVLLVGDITLRGVLASLYGTLALLTPSERTRVKGVLINKFRGDLAILEPGLRSLEGLIERPVLGVIPWFSMDLEDEDSVTDRFHSASPGGDVHVAIVKLKHISNFTDFDILFREEGVSVRYVERAQELEHVDVVILPGTKNTIEDLIDLKQRGLADEIVRHARRGGLLLGICGGYQMLGEALSDPTGSESRIPETAGLGLLPMRTTFHKDKITSQASGTIHCESGWLSQLNGLTLRGYEIHSGVNELFEGAVPFLTIDQQRGVDGITNAQGNVLGTYLHGLFDGGNFFRAIINHVRTQKGLDVLGGKALAMAEFREQELNRLADAVRASLDMDAIYRILNGEA